MIVDKKKSEHKKYPDSINGMVLLEENESGFVVIETETLKWIMNNKTDEELEIMGYGPKGNPGYHAKGLEIKERADIQERVPDFVNLPPQSS
jgi:hypothetical protein